MSAQDLAFYLEGFLTPPPWSPSDLAKFPDDIQKEIAANQKARISTGIGIHPKHGRFALVTAGQGPVIMWKENDV